MRKRRVTSLASDELSLLTRNVMLAESDEPPREFRIFKSGTNETTKGVFVFDDEAAALVMSEFEQHMSDGAQGLMIDLEHLSLDNDARNFDPDARGWAQLELRAGELWATAVQWTEDGARRLREKTQRFISPAFARDPETRRITKIINVAITALPATDQLTPLVAANQRGDQMDALKEALGLAEDATAEDVLNALNALKTKLSESEAALAKLQDGDDEDEETRKAEASIAASAREATGKTAPDEVSAALVALKSGAGSHTELASEVEALKATLRKRDVREMVRDNVTKIPPTLEEWALGQTPEALTAYLEKAPVVRKAPAREPTHPTDDEVTLTAEDIEVARQLGNDPADVLKTKKADAARARATH
jgi:phage I-like protein